MGVKDPTAWKDDLTFYKTEKAVAGDIEAMEPLLWDASEGIAELGVLYLHNDVFAKQAVACFDRAIAMRADNAKYYNLRGVALSQAGDAQRAAADWDTAMALAPNDPEPYVNRGVDALRRGDERDAIRSFEAAIEKDPKHGRAHGGQAGVMNRLLAEVTQASDTHPALGDRLRTIERPVRRCAGAVSHGPRCGPCRRRLRRRPAASRSRGSLRRCADRGGHGCRSSARRTRLRRDCRFSGGPRTGTLTRIATARG